jgi:bilin biosynthesis protein
MDKRFINMFNLTEEQAIQILDRPQKDIGEEDSRYIAAVQNLDPELDNRIVRRKSIESLGRLQATKALSVICDCFNDEDCYVIENSVWSIGEIGTHDPKILEEVARLLDRPGQSYRVIIHTLTKLDYQPALERIRKFTTDDNGPIASAAIAAVGRFTKDYSLMDRVVEFLQHRNVLARRLCIQDLIDAKYYGAIPHITYCPVSIVFRLRGVRMLADAGKEEGVLDFANVQSAIETVLRDHPQDLKMVHSHPQPLPLATLIRDLYDTDFGKCYLATQAILTEYFAEAPAALFATYAEEAHNDYGAHFHVVKLFGWLRHAPAYDLLVTALHNTQPQFQKSRAAAAIALGELGDPRAVPELEACLSTRLWDLKYAALIALGELDRYSSYQLAAADADWLVRAKAASKIST